MEPEQKHECETEDDEPHEGDIGCHDGYWLCWHHFERYYVDGVVIRGWIRKTEAEPWYND